MMLGTWEKGPIRALVYFFKNWLFIFTEAFCTVRNFLYNENVSEDLRLSGDKCANANILFRKKTDVWGFVVSKFLLFVTLLESGSAAIYKTQENRPVTADDGSGFDLDRKQLLYFVSKCMSSLKTGEENNGLSYHPNWLWFTEIPWESRQHKQFKPVERAWH